MPQEDSHTLEAWDAFNDPAPFGSTIERNIKRLPLAASLVNQPWSGYYWPHKTAGIAYRWQDPGSDPFRYQTPPTPLSGAALNSSAINALSPAEKFDLLRVREDFPLVKSERTRTSGDNNVSWSGICHGWAASAVLFQEPQAVTVVNAQGVAIPFASGDIAALLAHQLGVTLKLKTAQAGLRCQGSVAPDGSHPCGEDVNAGAFHLILTNSIGLKHTPFIIDSSEDAPIWNHVVTSYQVIPGNRFAPTATSHPETNFRYEMTVQVRIVVMAAPTRQGLRAQARNKTRVLTYKYMLEIDKKDNIIGGEWISNVRPDFAWSPVLPAGITRATELFTGEWAALGALYRASVGHMNGAFISPNGRLTPPSTGPSPRPQPGPVVRPLPQRPAPRPRPLPPTPSPLPRAPAGGFVQGSTWCVETEPGSGYRNSCMNFVSAHRFQQTALGICLGLSQDWRRLSCYQEIADKEYPADQIHACGVVFNPEENVACLMTLPSRRL